MATISILYLTIISIGHKNLLIFLHYKALTKLRGQDILRSSGVRVELDQLKFYEKHGFLAPTC